MGNSASSSGRGHHDESVDFGHLTPQGVYTGPRDWNQAVVSQLICARRIAPFYRPLEEYDESWDDDQILNARKELPESEMNESSSRVDVPYPTTHSKSSHSKRPGSLREPSKPEAAVYRGAIECPICFLYYPPNINHSRCCDQAICTECFVQIKRSEPTTTHLVSEPAACPYCVQDNFGVVYTPPPWRAGIGSDNMASIWSDSPKGPQNPIDNSTPYPTHKRRQKSFGADSPEVVTTDQIRPDWEAKLAAVRAAVTRRANRRIIMRQVGDRLIPVGVTSGRVHALSPEEAAAEGADGGSRRSRRRQQQGHNQNFEQFMGMAGQDLEELMLMEAMRLSLLDHEEQQRKEAEEKKKLAATLLPEGESANPGDASGPGPSNHEPHSSNSLSFLSSSPSSSQLSSTPSSAPQISPQERRSFSRTRTPSPAPPVTHASNQPTSESSSSWRRRTSSPPPFSTLTAALSAASMANAILGDSSQDNNSPAASGMVEDTSRPLTGRTAAGGSVPAIMIGEHNSTAQQDTGVGPNASTMTGAPSPSQRGKPLHFDSFQSGTSIDEPSYDPLLSSPESAITHEPLLDSRSESSSSVPLTRVTTSEDATGETNG